MKVELDKTKKLLMKINDMLSKCVIMNNNKVEHTNEFDFINVDKKNTEHTDNNEIKDEIRINEA